MVLPLAFCRGFAEQFSTPKFFITKFLIITALAIWGLGRIWTASHPRFHFNLALPLFAFSIAALISCLASPVPRFSLMEVEFALCGPAWVLLLSAWERGESAIRKVSVLIALAGALVAAITLLQRFGFDPVLLGGYQVDWGSMVARMRLYATFGNPNFVGGYLIGTIFAALALVAASKSTSAKVLWLSFAMIMLAAIIETVSCGAWLGLALGLAAAAVNLLPRKDSRHQDNQVSFWGSKSFVPPFAYGPMALLTLSLAGRAAAQFYGRLYLWRFSWPIFWQHPLMGSGWGTYQLFYLDLQGKFLSAHPEYAGYWTNNRLVHNDPLQVLLETGLLGFAAFVWVLGKYGQQALRVRRQSASAWPRYAIAASVGGVTAILVDSLFNYQFAVPPTYILLFTLLAIPSILRDDGFEKESGGQPLPALTARPYPRHVTWKGAGSIAIVAAASGLLWQQTRVLASERFYQTASDLEDHNDLAGAESTFRRSVELNDLNGRAHFGLSRVLFSRGLFSEALSEIALAERTYADSHQEVLRGLIMEHMGKNSEALAAYRHAFWLDPTLMSVQEDINRLGKPQSQHIPH